MRCWRQEKSREAMVAQWSKSAGLDQAETKKWMGPRRVGRVKYWTKGNAARVMAIPPLGYKRCIGQEGVS